MIYQIRGVVLNARCQRCFSTCTQFQSQLKTYGEQQVACFAVDQDEQGTAVA
ncbi:hypothetical protein Pcaca05_20520 [Pectobacterium carotovorum subsp. carotovorum]|nr:hypothetical protein Pcaca05_20520 [Pectobacterium carotovorum subsp. carotovorum]